MADVGKPPPDRTRPVWKARAPLHLLAQGDGWVVVAKPPHLIVHRNAFTRREYAALQRLRDQLGRRVYPIHRLDRAASGCLLFATEQAMAAPLVAALSGARKQYIALVRGHCAGPGPVEVNKPMKDDNGILKDAHTTVRCVATSKDPRCSLLLAEPSTGRFHQVRRHVRDLGHPVINDRSHGDTRFNRHFRDLTGYNRLGLHALGIDLELPDGKPLRVRCPLFVDQARVMRTLPWWEDALSAVPELGLEPLPLLDQVPTHEAATAP